ncbi:MAG: hypothetical protein M1834_009597 [Cirrosporium novae-zelandiae]|nr:MAG: hypothetical protein M1834_009597 [Cirrosporium novae-zelandiae]
MPLVNVTMNQIGNPYQMHPNAINMTNMNLGYIDPNQMHLNQIDITQASPNDMNPNEMCLNNPNQMYLNAPDPRHTELNIVGYPKSKDKTEKELFRKWRVEQDKICKISRLVEKRGQLFTNNTPDGTERKAIYAHLFNLIDDSDQYNHPQVMKPSKVFPERKGDITSFHPRYKHWGESRKDRSLLLFEYQRMRTDPNYESGPLILDDQIALNPDGHPIIGEAKLIAWGDENRRSDYWETLIKEEMTTEMHAANSTKDLMDRSKAEIRKHEIEQWGTETKFLNRTGKTKRLGDAERNERKTKLLKIITTSGENRDDAEEYAIPNEYA